MKQRPTIESSSLEITTSPFIEGHKTATNNNTNTINNNEKIILKALKERITQLEQHNTQANSTLQASENLVKSLTKQAAVLKEDLDEERAIRKGLQERLRVILEELEEIRAANAHLQSQIKIIREIKNEPPPVTKEPVVDEQQIEILNLQLHEINQKNESLQKVIDSQIVQIRDLNLQLDAANTKLRTVDSSKDAKLTHLRMIMQRFIHNPSEQVHLI